MEVQMLLSQVIAHVVPRQMLLPLADAVGVPAPPNLPKTLLKNVGTFATIGAALGFGASFFTLPIIGASSAPIAAAVGGAIGAVIGLVKGLLSVRKQNSAYEAGLGAQLVQFKSRMRAREQAHSTMILVVNKQTHAKVAKPQVAHHKPAARKHVS
ncbi:MAG: hypothetical protein H7123_05370 [Thermoleophilia bacterium]|nr:hypothetical protein [Thermoleophilia bacterium]